MKIEFPAPQDADNGHHRKLDAGTDLVTGLEDAGEFYAGPRRCVQCPVGLRRELICSDPFKCNAPAAVGDGNVPIRAVGKRPAEGRREHPVFVDKGGSEADRLSFGPNRDLAGEIWILLDESLSASEP